jgi:DNA repair protein RecO
MVKEHRELHIMASFDLIRLHAGLAADLERYATASALAEVMLRFAPADPHPESYDLLRESLGLLEVAPVPELEPLGFRALWQLVSALGFAPALEACVRDGTPLPAEGGLAFSTREGGALCPECAAGHGATRLPSNARADLGVLLDPAAPLPRLDRRHAESHRRLLARYIRYHLGEGAELPALEFWLRRPWMAA